ncbi:c-type cytochrome [Cupriavidus necator]|uniref:c-type cytochrome n=1 Tax=Cupriavidus necator TaxID=106590 RepID=UPI0005B342A6|nr:c-type cytochrome [Cupriavidus necator]
MSKLFRQAIAIFASFALNAGAVLAQNIESGKAVFAQCAACHSTDGASGAGPTLKGIIGRKAGTLEGFRYSRAMKSAGTAWDAESLSAFLTAPQKAVPGNVMPFPGIPDAKQIADVVAYLRTLK